MRLLFLLMGGLALLAWSGQRVEAKDKKIVFLAGTKSHGPGDHEYEKGMRLLARCLETSPNLRDYKTEVHLYGWPEDPSTLNDADAIVLYADGSDHNVSAHPFLVGDRLEVIRKQMQRGCGLVLLHYATFAPVKHGGEEYLEWAGGFFDYETGSAPNKWYSKIRHAETEPYPATPNHPIARGLKPFKLHEEYYYNMKFRPNDSRRVPILNTAIPDEKEMQTVAWAVQRAEGGRGFAFTGGHFHRNWQVENFRKMVLNAIVWTAKGEVPRGGVQSSLAPDQDDLRVLILTGHHHPAHDWRATTPALERILSADSRVVTSVWEDPERLATEDLSRYDLIVQNYCNWERPSLSQKSRERLLSYVQQGGGLLLVHFANGAWRDWSDYFGRLSRRIWVDGKSNHDAYGAFTVQVTKPNHLLTQGVADFPTTDELYCSQQGDLPVDPLLTARSKVTGKDEPLAYAYTEGKGRIFQTLLGHDAKGLLAPAHAEILRRACAWGARREVLPMPVQAETTLGTPRAPLPVVDRATSMDWANVGNDRGGMRYSTLTQINQENAKDLQVAWIYHTGDAEPAGSTIECTPIVVDGVMYLTTVKLKIVALDAATGKEIWKFDLKTGGVNRGVAYWSDNKPNGQRRIIAGLPDGRMISLDARTGRLDPNFGKGGVVNLRDGIERDISKMNYGCTSAPALYENLVIVPIVNTEGQPGAPGDIRAFDVRTGKQVWRFRTVPIPGEFGNDTWEGDGWKERSGTNAWAGYTVDVKNGIVFAGTGSASSDFYGADRLGNNLFANCTLALDARTGKRLWHFQTTHHDLWDHDNPCPPILCTVTHNGRKIEAAAQPTKTGFLFLFDRKTGKPLFEVKETPATPSDIPGEKASPTQPMPVKPPPLSPTLFTDADVTDRTSEATAHIREMLKSLRYGKPYVPPSLEGSVIMPGFHGGATWSGASFDPTTGVLYINTNNTPYICKLKANGQGGYDFLGYTYFYDQDGYPAVKPPWGFLTAVDLNRGEFLWRIPFGEYPALKAQGVPITGTESFGGTIVTAGGLVFIGGTRDEMFHAYDKTTGKLLWEYQLPAGGYATPSTYSVNGRQFVVIGAGGGGKLVTKTGDAYIAFALPKK